MSTTLESTAARQERALEKLEELAAKEHPLAPAIQNLLINEGDNIRALLDFSTTDLNGVTHVQVRGTNIATQFADLDDSESSPMTERTTSVSTH